jgi:hypothetical protein
MFYTNGLAATPVLSITEGSWDFVEKEDFKVTEVR